MMGQRQRIDGKLFYTDLSLDGRVRADNPLRKIKAAIDFDFVRSQVKHLYGVRGNPSVDPAVLMKLMLLLVLEDVRSERELMARMSERLDWMWFCGYDWDDAIPNHSVISKARRRWGVEVFGELFQRVLAQCINAGLVDGGTLHVDASVLKANADKDTLHPALRLAAEGLYGRLEQETADSPEAAVAQDSDTQEPPPGTLISSTDPEARVTRKNGQTVLGYKDHRVVDDRCGIITATVTTDAATAESHVINEALDQHERNVGSAPSTVVADKGYGTAAVYQSMARRDITPCIPHQNHKGGKGVGIYEASDFHYDADRDAYLCPQGQWLNRYCTTANGSWRYQAAKGICAGCPKRSLCTKAKDGRRVTRNVGQEWIDWADKCFSREHRRRLIRRRMYRAEGSFADAANNHGYKRSRWRGLAGMTIQNLLVAAAQNLRKLIRAGGKQPAMVMKSLGIVSARLHLGWFLRHCRFVFGLVMPARPVITPLTSDITQILTLLAQN
jgi:transposase